MGVSSLTLTPKIYLFKRDSGFGPDEPATALCDFHDRTSAGLAGQQRREGLR